MELLKNSKDKRARKLAKKRVSLLSIVLLLYYGVEWCTGI
jgi:hypothetical protein